MRWIITFLLCICLVLAKKTSEFVEPLTHDISIITPRNFDTQIQKYRDRFPAAIMFYTKTPEAKKFINDVWDPVAKQLKGMVRIGAVNCDEHAAFCQTHDADVSTSFQVKLLPPLPQPASPWAKSSDSPKTLIKQLATTLSRMIPGGQISKITNEQEMLSFVGNHAALPKILLFTDKTRASPLFNSLSHTFSDRMNFALISGNIEDPLFKKFHVKKTPTLVLKKGDLTLSVKGSQTFRGEMTFQAIHEWLNVHSETFVKGGGFLTEKEPEAQNITEIRPWLLHKVPEITKASHHDVCFKKGKGLCAIYLTHQDTLSAEETKTLEDLSDKFSAETKPGFHWSWMNVAHETNFAKLFNLEPESTDGLPSLAVFNPHSRLRFSKLPAEQTADEANISSFIEKIMSGDGRFKIVKGNRVPAFIPKRKPTKEEL